MTPAAAAAAIDELIVFHLEGAQRTTAPRCALPRPPPALDSGDATAALGALRRILAAFDGHHSPAATPDHRRALAALTAARITHDAITTAEVHP